MVLTFAQRQALRSDILAAADQPTITARNAQDWDTVAALYNAIVSPDHWVWRTSVLESEYTRSSGIDTDGVTVTNWSWTTYIGRSQGERDAWPRLFMGGGTGANPSLANVRQGVADIFSGAGGANQRAHLLAISRRKATRLEKLFATGTGTAVSPANLAAAANSTSAALTYVEGAITAQQISDAMGGL
jgi:hypothetical protein